MQRNVHGSRDPAIPAMAACLFMPAALALRPVNVLSLQRREVVKTASASAAVSLLSPFMPVSALEPLDGMLPPGAIEQLEAGRVVEVRNFLPVDEVSALRRDARACFDAGVFKPDALASYAQKSRGGAADPANDRKTIFYASKGIDGP